MRGWVELLIPFIAVAVYLLSHLLSNRQEAPRREPQPLRRPPPRPRRDEDDDAETPTRQRRRAELDQQLAEARRRRDALEAGSPPAPRGPPPRCLAAAAAREAVPSRAADRATTTEDATTACRSRRPRSHGRSGKSAERHARSASAVVHAGAAIAGLAQGSSVHGDSHPAARSARAPRLSPAAALQTALNRGSRLIIMSVEVNDGHGCRAVCRAVASGR
jgi:hypothetical protein